MRAGLLDAGLFGISSSCTCSREPPTLENTCGGNCPYMSYIENWMETECSLIDPVRCLMVDEEVTMQSDMLPYLLHTLINIIINPT